MQYKGYTIFQEKDITGQKKWAVGTLQPNGKMLVHARGFANQLTAKMAADSHFGQMGVATAPKW